MQICKRLVNQSITFIILTKLLWFIPNYFFPHFVVIVYFSYCSLTVLFIQLLFANFQKYSPKIGERLFDSRMQLRFIATGYPTHFHYLQKSSEMFSQVAENLLKGFVCGSDLTNFCKPHQENCNLN
jgi:hypothetical protein